MAGYNWEAGKSNNAVSAEENGRMPKSKIKKEHLREFGINISLTDLKLLIDNNYVRTREWHHTSGYFNRTEFFDLQEISENLSNEFEKFSNILSSLKKSKKNQPKKEITKFEDVFALITYEEFVNIGNIRNPKWIKETYSHYVQVLKETNSFYEFKDLENKNIFKKKIEKISINFKNEKEILKMFKKDESLIISKIYYEFKNTDLKKEDLESYKKLQKARTLKSFLTLIGNLYEESKNVFEKINEEKKQEDENKKIEKLMKKRSFYVGNKSTDDISIEEWLELPKQFKHPVPKYIGELKTESGLSWNEFESTLKLTNEKKGEDYLNEILKNYEKNQQNISNDNAEYPQSQKNIKRVR